MHITAECNWEAQAVASPPAIWSAAPPSPTSGKGLFYLLFWDFKKPQYLQIPTLRTSKLLL